MKLSKIKLSVLFLSISSSPFAFSADPVLGVDFGYYYEDNGKVAFKECTDDSPRHCAGSRNDEITASNMAIDIAGSHADEQATIAEKNSNDYTDSKIKDVNTYTDNASKQTLIDANKYTDTQINTMTSRIDNLDDKVDNNRKKASAGIAGAMAMSSIPQRFDYDFTFGMGVANFDSEQAISAGSYYNVNKRTTVSLKVSYDTQSNLGTAAGIAFGW